MFSVYVSPVETVNVQDVVKKVLRAFLSLSVPFCYSVSQSLFFYGRLVPRSLKEDTNASCVQIEGQSTESPLSACSWGVGAHEPFWTEPPGHLLCTSQG